MSQLMYYDVGSGQWLPVVVGAQGIQGPTGTQGVQGLQGAALWNFTGAWVNGVDYGPGDLVTYNGSLYYTATGVYSSYYPGYPGVDWVLAASKGDTGAQGVQGTVGLQGPLTGIATYIQPTQPSLSLGVQYLWWQTTGSNYTLWIEDGGA